MATLTFKITKDILALIPEANIPTKDYWNLLSAEQKARMVELVKKVAS